MMINAKFLIDPNIIYRKSAPQTVEIVKINDTQKWFTIEGHMADLFLIIAQRKDLKKWAQKFAKKNNVTQKTIDSEIQKGLKLFSKHKLITSARKSKGH